MYLLSFLFLSDTNLCKTGDWAEALFLWEDHNLQLDADDVVKSIRIGNGTITGQPVPRIKHALAAWSASKVITLENRAHDIPKWCRELGVRWTHAPMEGLVNKVLGGASTLTTKDIAALKTIDSTLDYLHQPGYIKKTSDETVHIFDAKIEGLKTKSTEST